MALNKFIYHTANMTLTLIMLNGNIDLTYLPISSKIQLTATAISLIFAKYVPETNIPLNIYANYFMYTYETPVTVCISHMNSLQSKI